MLVFLAFLSLVSAHFYPTQNEKHIMIYKSLAENLRNGFQIKYSNIFTCDGCVGYNQDYFFHEMKLSGKRIENDTNVNYVKYWYRDDSVTITNNRPHNCILYMQSNLDTSLVISSHCKVDTPKQKFNDTPDTPIKNINIYLMTVPKEFDIFIALALKDLYDIKFFPFRSMELRRFVSSNSITYLQNVINNNVNINVTSFDNFDIIFTNYFTLSFNHQSVYNRAKNSLSSEFMIKDPVHMRLGFINDNPAKCIFLLRVSYYTPLFYQFCP